MKKISLVLIFSLLVSVLGFQSCNKDNDALQAPNLPELKMMVMDFNGFETVDPDQRSFSNWFHAAINVYFWSRTIAETLEVPVAALVAAFEQEAVYIGDNTWMWTYSISVEEGDFTVNFYGSLTDQEEIAWSMYVSKAGDFEDFLWFTGVTAYDETYSNWILNSMSEDPSSPYEPIEFVKIEYQNNLTDGTEQIRYTNIIPDNEGNGGYIQYGSMVNDDYQVFYDIYDIAEDNYTLIQFNTDTEYGRVKDAERFHDQEWHCWDNNTDDIECP